MMLKEGDLIMHETAGVCRVDGETKLDGLSGVLLHTLPAVHEGRDVLHPPGQRQGEDPPCDEPG